MALVAFGIVALIAVGSGIGLVVRRNPIHGALFLVVNLASVAILYLQMRAEFLALAQVIIYAGAIMVLFVFAIMVLIPGKEETGPDPKRPVRLLAIALAGLLLIDPPLHDLEHAGTGPASRQHRGGGPAALHRLPPALRDRLGPAPRGHCGSVGTGQAKGVIICRLMKKAHLRRRLSSEGGTPPFRNLPPSLRERSPRSNGECGCASLRRTTAYASVVPPFAALHLDLFDQPELTGVFHDSYGS